MERFPETPRHVAVQVALQIYGNIDPDTSRYLAEKALFAADRATWRGHSDSGPTHDEVNRLTTALERRGIGVEPDAAYGALLAALCPGLVKEEAA